MINLTTDGVPAHERVEYWADLVSQHVTPMRMEPSRRRPFFGEIHAHAIGGLAIAQVSGAGIHALHQRAEVARATGHLYAAAIVLDGATRIYRNGEWLELGRNDVFITDSRHEFTLDLDLPWRNLVVSLPTEWLDARLARPERLAGMVVRGNPLLRMWSGHLANGFAMASDFSPPAATMFARHSVELLAQALEELSYEQTTALDGRRSGLFLTACRVIAIRFGDSDLGPEQIARELRISTRSLARVFASNDTTVMQRVFDERIHHAMTRLAAPEWAHRSITEIAFACGFNDSSHFGRVFAARMQMTPSQWRRSQA